MRVYTKLSETESQSTPVTSNRKIRKFSRPTSRSPRKKTKQDRFDEDKGQKGATLDVSSKHKKTPTVASQNRRKTENQKNVGQSDENNNSKAKTNKKKETKSEIEFENKEEISIEGLESVEKKKETRDKRRSQSQGRLKQGKAAKSKGKRGSGKEANVFRLEANCRDQAVNLTSLVFKIFRDKRVTWG